MPLRGQAKREYQRLYMANKRATNRGGDRDSKGKGVRPRRNVRPPLENRESVRPMPIPMSPQTMSKAELVDYLAHVGQRGFSLVKTTRGYDLVANTGQLVPFDGVALIEGQLRAHGQRIIQLEAEVTVQGAALARLELMMDSMLRERDLL